MVKVHLMCCFHYEQAGSITTILCTSAGGLSWCYAGLMKSLGTDYPIYGVQARGIAKNEELPKSLEEMAADYLKHVREVQPHGPYRLLGWSLGKCCACNGGAITK